MKLVKLSLVAALAAGAFSAANATPLEEAIKDIDVSGVLRYRYESSNPWSNDNFGSGISGKQDHKYRAQVNFNAAIADNFKAFVQFDYNSKDGGYGENSISNTSDTLSVRQLYLTYTNEDVATSVIAGKQQLNTIWTDNGVDGLVGTGIKVVNNSIDGLTLAAFAVDSFNEASDSTVIITQNPGNKITGVQFNRGNPQGDSDTSGALNWDKNLYGAAAIGSYEFLGGQFNPQLWLAYMSDNAFLYAVDAAYSTTIFDGINWTLEGAYLGNSLDSKLKNALSNHAANGNFFALRGSVELNGWDASLGGLYYGKKDKVTLTTIEDQGNLGSLLAGEEIFYTNGSNLNGDIGRNIFGYVTAGYTFNETVRVGADFVYGGTKTGEIGNGGKKLEAVARVDYKYSPKLNFSAFYSYVNVNTDPESTHHDAVRLQALYKF
ncbi:major outer membrane protein [Campylobacter jejuni]|uniref:major outer membrane protein n=1 Tax=Campylobacter TaxID=194 RepID=UPI0008740307|nr:MULTISPECIES: major outer membrane protein [Campylobacter]ECL2826861.1 major outer membrane protein [Campylobacter jejuni]ECL9473983.1 major outer membrane protein [Campylobacter jejuni]EGD0206992.1 major outer membrane protein [Campylobacter jejuni]EJF0794147.1 major outer membrane protein [Campylobacter jejuni]ELN6397173.1 major outer membrane protein [Campylobacter jejuni]